MTVIDKYSFSGKRALIRVDFNVPMNKETLTVTDNTRIKAAIPTIKKVLDAGGSVVLMSHMGRPKSGPEQKYSLENIVFEIEKELGQEVIFAGDCTGNNAFEITSNLKPGNVVLLENLRFYPQEKAGDKSFAEKLAKHGDLYINDAFGTAHRAHASTTVVAEFFPNDKMFGYLIEREIVSVDKVLNSSEKPLTAIVGGAKVSSKITIINKLIDKVDNLIIGGGMAYTFAKANGGKVGNSLVEDDFLEMAKAIMSNAKTKGVNLLIPIDTVIADSFSNDANIKSCSTDSIPNGWMGLDIAEESITKFKRAVLDSKLILWNGPMGVFEKKNFENGTKEIANLLSELKDENIITIVGGGDSASAIRKFSNIENFTHVSTGGGASLELLSGKSLPAIEALGKL